MLGTGSLFAIVLCDYYGRLPVLLGFHLMGSVTTIWNAVATNYPSFLASRVLNGLFSNVAQATGLIWIKDMFFLHEHPRKINLFVGGYILAPYLGPFTAAFIMQKTTWRWALQSL
jgi:MFS family permease